MLASPCWMGLWVNVEFQHIARLSPSRARGMFAAIGHYNGDFVVIWVNIFFHAGLQFYALLPVRDARFVMRQNDPRHQTALVVYPL